MLVTINFYLMLNRICSPLSTGLENCCRGAQKYKRLDYGNIFVAVRVFWKFIQKNSLEIKILVDL